MFVNMELYRVFYFTARERSISRAAQQLFISQPAVSQSIRQLEDKLGGKLFFRTPKGITLTGEGEVFFGYIEQAYNFISMAEKKFAEMQNLMAGEITVGASDMTCKFYLLPYLEAFRKIYPQVKIHVTNGTTPEAIRLLKKGAIDLGIISLPIEDDEHLAVTECMTIQDCFVAGENYRHLEQAPISLAELARFPILLLEKGSSTRRYIDNYAKQHGCELIPEIELATSDLLVQFAKKGLGIACVVRNFAEEEIDKRNLFEIRLKEEIPPRKLGVVALDNVPLSAAAKKFMQMLKE